MGRRGPPPKPTHLKLLAGNPGKKPLNTREPSPKKGIPRCPEWLTEDAKLAFRRLTETLKDMGIVSLSDRDAMTSYAQVYSLWKEMSLFIQKHGVGYPIKDDKGNLKGFGQFPQVAVQRNCLVLMKAYQQEFGLTPASRSRVVRPAGDAVDEEANAFFGW